MSTWSLELPYTSPPLSLNRHTHHMKEARLRDQVKSDVGWLVRAAKVPKGLDRIHVTLLWHPKHPGTRDTDNPSPTLKPAIDALVKYGVVSDDNHLHVSSSVEIADTPADRTGWKHGMWLVINDITTGVI